MVHDFEESLKRSHAYEDAPWWREVYERAFHNLQEMVSVRQDGWAQRAGIDRRLILADGTVLSVDEKVRERDYPDFCLEYWSDRKRQIPGWVAKDLTCDYIAYAFVPSRTCYLLPFQLLRRAWREHHRRWVGTYRKVEALNRGYVTVSVAVPIEVVLEAISDAMAVRWSATADHKESPCGEIPDEELYLGYWERRFEEEDFS
ncbi:hypothetical protein [Rubrobacter calidifluminis]|uniref:hypothetical protein n=1 Tax=Rubrobacter calidifluminis TaxID=1392640 RepID=UPI0023602A5F|nr:hypothetical protein [Rubrobacter calidifluminis]